MHRIETGFRNGDTGAARLALGRAHPVRQNRTRPACLPLRITLVDTSAAAAALACPTPRRRNSRSSREHW